MNIFYTSDCPKQAALDLCKIHLNKMIIEYTQLLSTAHSVLDNNLVGYYPTHVNHPSCVWVREYKSHYQWLFNCLSYAHKIYEASTGKVHGSKAVLDSLALPPVNINSFGEFKAPPVAAPDEFKVLVQREGTCKAYQKYLCSKFKEWQSRDNPLSVVFPIRNPSWYV